jgi:hypothetical protein
MKGFLIRFKALPIWAQWMPTVFIILMAMLIGAVVETRTLRSQLAAVNSSTSSDAQSTKPYAHRRISYQDANAIYDQLKQPLYDTGMFYKKSSADRTAYVRAALELRDKVEPIFGVPSPCFSAANMRLEYVRNLIIFAMVVDGRSQIKDWHDLTQPMYTAAIMGEAIAGCYQDVEALQ